MPCRRMGTTVWSRYARTLSCCLEADDAPLPKMFTGSVDWFSLLLLLPVVVVSVVVASFLRLFPSPGGGGGLVDVGTGADVSIFFFF